MFFRRKVKDQPNPWLKIDHPCIWLPANDGKEEVCGDCGRRRNVADAKKKED